MASIADLFKLADGSTYQNTLAQIMQMMNQYENRAVQRDEISQRDRQAALNYDSQTMDTMSQNMRHGMDDQRMREKQAQDLQYNYADLGERRENNTGNRGIAQQNADSVRMNAETNQMSTMGDLFYKGKEDQRADRNQGMKEYDWQESKMQQEVLGKALQEGGVEGYAQALGSMGRTDDMLKVNNFQELYKRNMYMNQQTLLDTMKTGDDLEAGRRLRAGFDISNKYIALNSKDPDLADREFENDLANSPYFKDMDPYVAKLAFPSMVMSDAQSLGKLGTDKNQQKAFNRMFQGFGQAVPYDDAEGTTPTKEMQNLAAIKKAEASGDIEGAQYLRSATQKQPLVKIGNDGKEISPSTQASTTEWQKKSVNSAKVISNLEPMVENLAKPENQALMTIPGKAGTAVARGKAWWGVANEADAKRISDAENLINPMLRSMQDYVLMQAGTTFTEGLITRLNEQWVNQEIDGITALERGKTILDSMKSENQFWNSQLAQGGANVTNGKADNSLEARGLSQDQQAAAAANVKQQTANSSEGRVNALKVAEENAWNAGDDQAAAEIRAEILRLEGGM